MLEWLLLGVIVAPLLPLVLLAIFLLIYKESTVSKTPQEHYNAIHAHLTQWDEQHQSEVKALRHRISLLEAQEAWLNKELMKNAAGETFCEDSNPVFTKSITDLELATASYRCISDANKELRETIERMSKDLSQKSMALADQSNVIVVNGRRIANLEQQLKTSQENAEQNLDLLHDIKPTYAMDVLVKHLETNYPKGSTIRSTALVFLKAIKDVCQL
jgi:chromosome segregation ATPase